MPSTATPAPSDAASRLLSLLTPGQVQVVAWYYFDGFHQREIAEFLGIQRGSVHARLEKIRKRLATHGVPPLSRRIEPRRETVRLVHEELVESDAGE